MKAGRNAGTGKIAEERDTKTITFLFHACEIRIEGFTPEEALNSIGSQGIAMNDIRIEDETTVYLTVRAADVPVLENILGKKYRIEVLRSFGLIPSVKRILRRKGLVAGVFCFAAILILQQSFIAEIRIHGNAGVSESEISAVLKESGLYVGCKKSGIDKNEVRNSLYDAFPDITWAGVELKGAFALVEVAEGDKISEKNELSTTPCDVVAAKSGYIKDVITRSGTQLVKSGDYVQAGDVLISSQVKANNLTYDESRNDLVKYVHAAGDVSAVVVYKLEAQFDRKKFTEQEMRDKAEAAVRKYIREKIPEKIEILKKDLKFHEEENIMICRITLEVSENIGYEKETEFAGT